MRNEANRYILGEGLCDAQTEGSVSEGGDRRIKEHSLDELLNLVEIIQDPQKELKERMDCIKYLADAIVTKDEDGKSGFDVIIAYSSSLGPSPGSDETAVLAKITKLFEIAGQNDLFFEKFKALQLEPESYADDVVQKTLVKQPLSYDSFKNNRYIKGATVYAEQTQSDTESDGVRKIKAHDLDEMLSLIKLTKLALAGEGTVGQKDEQSVGGHLSLAVLSMRRLDSDEGLKKQLAEALLTVDASGKSGFDVLLEAGEKGVYKIKTIHKLLKGDEDAYANFMKAFVVSKSEEEKREALSEIPNIFMQDILDYMQKNVEQHCSGEVCRLLIKINQIERRYVENLKEVLCSSRCPHRDLHPDKAMWDAANLPDSKRGVILSTYLRELVEGGGVDPLVQLGSTIDWYLKSINLTLNPTEMTMSMWSVRTIAKYFSKQCQSERRRLTRELAATRRELQAVSDKVGYLRDTAAYRGGQSEHLIFNDDGIDDAPVYESQLDSEKLGEGGFKSDEERFKFILVSESEDCGGIGWIAKNQSSWLGELYGLAKDNDTLRLLIARSLGDMYESEVGSLNLLYEKCGLSGVQKLVDFIKDVPEATASGALLRDSFSKALLGLPHAQRHCLCKMLSDNKSEAGKQQLMSDILKLGENQFAFKLRFIKDVTGVQCCNLPEINFVGLAQCDPVLVDTIVRWVKEVDPSTVRGKEYMTGFMKMLVTVRHYIPNMVLLFSNIFKNILSENETKDIIKDIIKAEIVRSNKDLNPESLLALANTLLSGKSPIIEALGEVAVTDRKANLLMKEIVLKALDSKEALDGKEALSLLVDKLGESEFEGVVIKLARNEHVRETLGKGVGVVCSGLQLLGLAVDDKLVNQLLKDAVLTALEGGDPLGGMADKLKQPKFKEITLKLLENEGVRQSLGEPFTSVWRNLLPLKNILNEVIGRDKTRELVGQLFPKLFAGGERGVITSELLIEKLRLPDYKDLALELIKNEKFLENFIKPSAKSWDKLNFAINALQKVFESEFNPKTRVFGGINNMPYKDMVNILLQHVFCMGLDSDDPISLVIEKLESLGKENNELEGISQEIKLSFLFNIKKRLGVDKDSVNKALKSLSVALNPSEIPDSLLDLLGGVKEIYYGGIKERLMLKVAELIRRINNHEGGQNNRECCNHLAKLLDARVVELFGVRNGLYLLMEKSIGFTDDLGNLYDYDDLYGVRLFNNNISFPVKYGEGGSGTVDGVFGFMHCLAQVFETAIKSGKSNGEDENLRQTVIKLLGEKAVGQHSDTILVAMLLNHPGLFKRFVVLSERHDDLKASIVSALLSLDNFVNPSKGFYPSREFERRGGLPKILHNELRDEDESDEDEPPDEDKPSNFYYRYLIKSILSSAVQHDVSIISKAHWLREKRVVEGRIDYIPNPWDDDFELAMKEWFEKEAGNADVINAAIASFKADFPVKYLTLVILMQLKERLNDTEDALLKAGIDELLLVCFSCNGYHDARFKEAVYNLLEKYDKSGNARGKELIRQVYAGYTVFNSPDGKLLRDKLAAAELSPKTDDGKVLLVSVLDLMKGDMYSEQVKFLRKWMKPALNAMDEVIKGIGGNHGSLSTIRGEYLGALDPEEELQYIRSFHKALKKALRPKRSNDDGFFSSAANLFCVNTGNVREVSFDKEFIAALPASVRNKLESVAPEHKSSNLRK